MKEQDLNDEIECAIIKWGYMLNLGHYTIEFKTVRSRDIQNSKPHEETLAKVLVKPNYLTAIIVVSRSILEEDIDDIILHEMVHILVADMRMTVFSCLKNRITVRETEILVDTEERVVCRIVKVIKDLVKINN